VHLDDARRDVEDQQGQINDDNVYPCRGLNGLLPKLRLMPSARRSGLAHIYACLTLLYTKAINRVREYQRPQE
jgi:hypothetical protein